MTPYPGQLVEALEPSGYWRKCRVVRLVHEGDSPFLVDPPRTWLVEPLRGKGYGIFDEQYLRCDVKAEIAAAMVLLAEPE